MDQQAAEQGAPGALEAVLRGVLPTSWVLREAQRFQAAEGELAMVSAAVMGPVETCCNCGCGARGVELVERRYAARNLKALCDEMRAGVLLITAPLGYA